ncbi:MAG: hypothetical protein H0V19_08025, partial [Euzebyales bacterium]|nr:hypothetical protein [Euzebyales bacterium]
MAAVGAGGTPTYRGEDRRGGAVVAASPFAPAFWVASVGLVAVWAVTTFALDPSETSRVDTVIVTDLLQTGGTMLAAAVGGMCVARWRLSGDAPSLWLGAATLTYAIVRLALVELLPLTVRGGLPAAFTGFLRPASLVVTAGLLMRGAVVPAVDSRLGGRRLLALTAAALGLATALFAVAPALASLVDGAAAALPRSYARYNALGLMPLVWLVLAAVLLSR